MFTEYGNADLTNFGHKLAMDCETSFDPALWAQMLHKVHKAAAGEVIATHLTMNASNPVASANWWRVQEEYVKLTLPRQRVAPADDARERLMVAA